MGSDMLMGHWNADVFLLMSISMSGYCYKCTVLYSCIWCLIQSVVSFDVFQAGFSQLCWEGRSERNLSYAAALQGHDMKNPDMLRSQCLVQGERLAILLRIEPNQAGLDGLASCVLRLLVWAYSLRYCAF